MAQTITRVSRRGLGLPQHYFEGYTLLLRIDRRQRRQFRAVGVSAFLRHHLGEAVGLVVYNGLKVLDLIKPLGYVGGRGLGKSVKEFLVTRRRVYLLRIGYRPKRSPSTVQRGSVRSRRPAGRNRRAIGAYVLVERRSRRRAKKPLRAPKRLDLLGQLLVHAGLDPRDRPARTEVHFFFDRTSPGPRRSP